MKRLKPMGYCTQSIVMSTALLLGCLTIPVSVTVAGCLPSVNIDWTYRSGDKLPLGQSRPGAKVTLFADFDGGSYSGVSTGPLSSYYDSGERRAIEKAIEHVAGNYARFDINVTTDKRVFDKAKKRGRIFIAKGEGSSGKASTDGISSSSRYTGWVGEDAVMDPGSSEKCAYVLTHEFGHNFKMRGTDRDYADMYPNAEIGAFMGGRDRQFKGYDWIALENKKGDWQDPVKMIVKIAGYANTNPKSTPTQPEQKDRSSPSNPGNSSNRWHMISSSNFERGWDDWNDGSSSSDAMRVNTSFSPSGRYSVRLKDNSGYKSRVVSNRFNLESYNFVQISFEVKGDNHESSDETFKLSFYDGESWFTLKTYRPKGHDFSDGSTKTHTFTLDSRDYKFDNNSRFLFESNGSSSNSDFVFLDEIEIKVK